MDTYNIYMDEIPTGSELDGEAGYEVEFRVAAIVRTMAIPKTTRFWPVSIWLT